MQIFSYGDIKEITEQGIYMNNGYCIYFSECLANFRRRLKDETTICVAERDYSKSAVLRFLCRCECNHTI